MKRILALFVSLFFISWLGYAQTVSTVTTTSATGQHKIGDVITIRVTFSAAVDVAGSPRIQLNVTPSTTYANAAAANNVTQVDFTYTVQSTDVSSRLDYSSTSALTLNGGTIFAQGTSTPATLTLPAVASSGLYTTNLVIDGVAPTGYAVAIDQSVINNTNKAAVSFTFTSAEVGATYNYSIDDAANAGTSAITGTGTVAAANSQITGINTTTLDDGTLTLTVHLTDAAGNQGSDATNTKTKDVVAPTGYSVSLDQSFINNTNKAVVSFTFTSAEIGATYNYSIDDAANAGTSAITGTGTVAAANSQITGINTTTLDDGTLTLTVHLTDAAGNQGGDATNTKTKDVVAPTGYSVSIDQSVINNSNKAAVSFTFAGAEVGASYSYSIDDAANAGTVAITGTGTITSSNLQITGINTTTLDDGTLTLTVFLTDPAGNQGGNVNDTKTKNASPPTVTITRNAVTLGSFAATTDNTISYAVIFNKPINSSTFTTADISVAHGGTTASTGNTLTNPSADNQNFVYTLNSVTGDGIITITVGPAIDDNGGNTMASSQGPSAGFTIDNTAPAQPATPDLVAGSDSGSSSSDNITNNLSPQFSVGTTEAGATVRIFSSVDAGSRGSAVASGATTTVSTTLITQGNNQTHSITAVQTDAAGNPSSTSSGLTITLDATPPTITSSSFFGDNANAPQQHHFSCGGTTTTNTSTTEFFHIILSEPLALTDGTLVTVGASTGFNVSPTALTTIDVTCDTRGASVYHNGGTTIHLKSANDNDWDGNTKVNFVSGATNIKDAAGNEMGSFSNLTPPDNQAPYIASGLVFNPNGAAPETITFFISETLNASVGTTPTGFTVSQPSAGTVPTQSYNAGTKLITLTSAADGQWTDAVLLSYASGNIKDPANNAMATVSSLPIRLKNVNIISNNANNQLARPSNTITLSYVNTGAAPTSNAVTIDGVAATVSGSNPNYTATLVTTAANTTGPLSFQIDFQTAADVTLVTATTNTPVGSSVTFDKTAPTYTSLTIASNGTNTTYAKPGNDVVVTFTVSEALGALPTATIDGKTATVVNTSGLNYTATVTTDNTYTNGTLGFSISSSDMAGNTVTGTAITSGNPVTFDKTPPVVASIASSSTLKGIGVSQGIVATSVSFLVTFTETNVPLTGIDANGADFTVSKDASVNYTTLSVTGSGTTRTVTVNGITGTGRISLGLNDDDTILDAASNPLGGTGAGNGSIAPAFSGTQYYTIALPEPTNPVASLTAPTVTSSSITVEWSQPVAGAQAATHYLVLAKPSVDTYPAVADGGYVADGPLAQNIVKGAGTQTAVFSVSSGTSYDFVIYPYTIGTNNSNDNIDFKTTTPAGVTGVVTNSASVSTMVLNSAPVSISSITDTPGESFAVMQFTIYDDGLDPVSPNVMVLNLNGLAQESISFQLRDELTLTEGANVTGFTSSTGVIASAIYSGKGTTNTITLTSTTDGAWTLATTITYSSATGNVQFLTLGKMQSIAAHNVVQAADITQTLSTSGTFIVPTGVTKITVETWGAGGSGGEYSIAYGPGSSGGGGGGAYSRSLLNVTPGASYNYVVGTGGASRPAQSCCTFGNNGGSTSFGGSLVVAEGGWAGLPSAWYNVYGPTDANPFYTYGGRSSAGIGDVKYNGGQGGYGQKTSLSSGGAGGSSAGTNADGNDGAVGILCSGCLSAGGSAPVAGGAGGSGAESSGGVNGIAPGGGGGGTGSPFSSGAGANGQIRITYSDPSPLTGQSDWDSDNSPFKFSQLIITQGTGNSAALADWRDIIAVGGAELYDGINPTPVTGTVNATNITFSSIPSSASTDVGFVPDANGTASSKTYTLKIWLKNSLNTTLASAIDGLNLAFKVDPTVAANLTYNDVSNSNQKSSRLIPSTPPIESGSNPIAVVATQLDFSTNPISPVFVSTNVTATPVAPDFTTVPVIRARDANGNTDKNYTTTLTVSNAGTLPWINTTLTMTSGVAAFSSTLQYQDSGDGTLTVSGGGLTSAISSPVVVNYSNTTAITTGTVAPLISSLKTSNPYLRVFDFNITDDNGSGGDGAPTRFNELILNEGPGDDFSDWSEALAALPTAGILLYDGTTSVFGAIGANTITFSGINPNTLGYVTDNTTKTYQVWILLKSAMGGTLPDDVDNKNFVFRVQDTFITTAGSSSAFTGTNDINSGSANIKVDVIASKLKFSADPAASLLVGKDISSQLPVPVVEALDANNNRDLNYNSTTVNVTNSGSLTMSNMPGNGSFINGLLTFPNTFQFNTTGTGVTLNVSSTAPAPALPGVLSTSSTSFDVRGGDAGTITASSALTEPPTISSLVDLTHTPAGLPVFDFTINDDPAGTPAGEDDGNPTQLTGLYIRAGSGNTVLGWDDAFATATLSDGTNTVTVTTIHSSNYFYFDLSSVAGQALGLIADNGSKTYTLKVWLKTALGGTLPTTIDGKFFVFDVKKTAIDITTGVNSTNIIDGQTQNSGIGKNQVDVHATQIDFTTQPISASVSVPVSPQIIVSARDINANLDIDFISGVTITGNIPVDPGPFVTANDPASGDLFSAGQLTYPANFQFTVGDGDVKLTISAGSISGTSAVISSLTSYDSWLYFDPTFGYTPKIDFANKQEDPTTATSQILGRLILSDGGSATSIATFDPTPFNPLDDALYNPQRGVKNQINHGDSDGAFTRISDFTISLSNYQDIRKIALYASDGVTQIGTDKTPAATVTFNNIGDAHKAPDNGIYTFYIRASFKTTVTDLDQVAMQVTAVTHHSGSKFSEQLPVSPPATIAGVDGATTFGDSSPLTVAGVPVNILDVIATSLDFTHQANPPYAGINEPVGKVSPLFTVPYATAPLPNTDAAIVSARDKFANLDTEFNYAPTITQTAGPNTPISAPRNFAAGILRLDGMQYPSTGDGTLKVIANGIDSSTPASGTHIPGQLVNVVHVSVIPATAGVLSTPNIKGGTPNAVLFGVTFTPDFSTTSEPNLKKFVFSFDDFYATSSSTILKNFRVTESLSAAFSGSTDVTLSSAIVTTGSSTNTTDLDLVIVDWGSNPSRPLFDITTGAPVSRSYFLVADVDVSANIGTPNLTPQLVDGGYISSSTDAHIVTSAGTATSNVIGQKYQFASTRPPVLKANLSSPFNGQLNVDAGLTEIDLVFDVQVWSLDGVGELFSRTNNKKVANLNAINGNYVDLSTPAANPLRFSINFLPGESFQPDEVYYVTIKKGSFNNNNNTGSGISDNGFNFYGGISSNATLYFKISSLNPPNLISAKSYFGNGTTASFSTNFDKAGTAHYMVLPTGSSAPSAAQIRNPVTYPGYPVTVTAADSYAITQVNTFQTVSFSAALSVTTYDVWIVSENDANPTHKATTAPYGSSAVSFAIGGAGPTLKITVPTPAPIRSNNFPTYSVCPDSYTTLSEPIIIGEPAAGTFNSGSTLQTFYILLPTGFQFDGVTEPTVSLNGADFDQSSLNVDFENNTLLEISYRNTTSTTIDNIVITGLKVKGTSGSSLGYIKRFAGNANLGGASQLATIFLATDQIHTFTNSYSKDNDFTPFGFSSLDVITAIPDNYVDKDATLTGAIRLQPTITAANDYGASFFTGNGVTNDVLSLSAVTVDAAFDITMTHTDPNGCTSESSVQYVVYDHRSPVSIKLGQSLGGTQQSLVNPNFPNQTPAIIFPNSTSPQINYNELAGYNLIKLFATIPTNAGTQIISGPDWKNQIAKIPVVKTQYPTSNIPGMPPGTGFYRDYQWDYNHILNAVSESQLDNPSTSIVKDPYDNFKVIPTGKAPYWTGGSLGKIEFVGTYQSTADFTVLVPFKQQVELFVPPIPVVEVDQSNQPVKGTAIYCEAGGGISITGYPQASAASSTGIFSLTTSTGIPLVVPSGAFIDNGNGTATLFPNLFNNAYSDIKINYTYQDNNSPVSGVGAITITVAPNPISALTISSVIGVNTPFNSVFCEKTAIDFNASSSSITNGFIKDYLWSFGDITNSTGTNPNIDSAMVSKHTFIQPAAYTISLTTTSDVGCVSTPKTSTLKVGSIPNVAFEFKGVSVDEGITFKNTSAIPSESISGLNDGFAKVDWNFGDGTPVNSVTTPPFTNTDIVHKYATAGLDHVNLKISSLLGCVNTLTQDIIVLANEKPSPIASYEENFETSNGKWQPSSLPITSGSTNPASWLVGAPSNPVIKIDPTINNGKFVKTGAVSYNPSERSAFYSPVFDLSELERPMVSFNSFTQLETSDGVVFEYSTDDKNVADPSKTWSALGQPGEGVQWFTDRGIAAKPGNQIGNDYGWSKADIIKWVESKHLIDATAKASRVVFRFALASVKTPAVDGFAFDNFRVGERTRTILMENFTTTNGKDAVQNSTIKTENDFINTTFETGGIGTTIVKLNYHIGFTGTDPFNADGPADPSARALYYNVKDVPYALLDGARPNGAAALSGWGVDAYNAQTLQLGRSKITVPDLSVNADGSIRFNIDVQALLYDLPENTILHVALIEQDILKSALSAGQQAQILTGENSFTYVLKQMLPNALGTKLGALLAKNQTKQFKDFEYYPDPTRLYANANDLAIIVFLQNEDTKEIYQTEYITGISDPPTVTGLENGLRIEDVTFYPNPADNELNILLPRKAIGDVTIQLFDQVGKSVLNSTIKNGEQKGTLNVQGLAESMYLMRLVENGEITMKKVMVVHQN